MPLSYVHDPDTRILHVSVLGGMTGEEVDELFREIGDAADIPNDTDTIWNLDGYEFANAERRVFQIVINGRPQFPGRHRARSVLVVESDLGFGMCRMYQSMCKLDLGHADNRTHVARSESEAIEWLCVNDIGLMGQHHRQL